MDSNDIRTVIEVLSESSGRDNESTVGVNTEIPAESSAYSNGDNSVAENITLELEITDSNSFNSALKNYTESQQCNSDGDFTAFSVVISTDDDIVNFTNKNSEVSTEFPSKKSATKRSRRPFKCRKCGKVFERRIDMHIHRLNQHPPKDDVPKKRRKKDDDYIKMNMQSHHLPNYTKNPSHNEDISYRSCKHCGVALKDDLDQHDCSEERFHREENYGSKLAIMSTDKKQFTCLICGTCFSRRGNLQRHELIHTALKPYICPCGKGFTQPSHLKAHEVTHTKERPFECSECRMTFTRKGNLKRHVQLHREKANVMKNMQAELKS